MTQKISLNILRKGLSKTKKTNAQVKKTFKIPSLFKKTKDSEKLPSYKKNIFDIASEDCEEITTCNLRLETEIPSALPFEHQQVLSEVVSTNSTQLIQSKEVLSHAIDSIYSECKNGISTTTITLENDHPDSLFSHCEVTIEHYDTAPHCFNIQLSGSLQAVNAFNANLKSLQIHLDQRLASFQVQLLHPILKETKGPKGIERRKNIRRKKDGQIKKTPF